MIKSINTKLSRTLLLLISFAMLFFITACGGSLDDGTTTTGTNTVSVSALPSTLAAGETSIISADVSVGGASGSTIYSEGVAVTFTILTNNSGATITPVGSGESDYLGNVKAIYTAGANNPTEEVVDIIQASTGKSTSVYQITRTASSASTGTNTVSVSALPSTLAAGETSIISADVSVGGASGSTIYSEGVAVTFTILTNNSGATITPVGSGESDYLGNVKAIYTAGANNPTEEVVDIIQAKTSKSTSVYQITRTASSASATVFRMTVTADVTSLEAGNTTTLTATVTESPLPVSGAIVSFNFMAGGNVSGGTVTAIGGGVTDSSGKAYATYTAGSINPTINVQDVITGSASFDVYSATNSVIVLRKGTP